MVSPSIIRSPSWWWTERPSEICRVLFQNKINLRYCESSWSHYRKISRCTALQTSKIQNFPSFLNYALSVSWIEWDVHVITSLWSGKDLKVTVVCFKVRPNFVYKYWTNYFEIRPLDAKGNISLRNNRNSHLAISYLKMNFRWSEEQTLQSLIVKYIQQDATIAFILRNVFTLHVSGDNSTHHQEYICCIWPQVGRYTYVVIFFSVLW